MLLNLNILQDSKFDGQYTHIRISKIRFSLAPSITYLPEYLFIVKHELQFTS